MNEEYPSENRNKLKKLKRLSHLMICTALVMGTMSSCTVVGAFIDDAAANEPEVIVTHQEVMNSFTTKREVLTEYGVPSKRDSVEGIEIWFYEMKTSFTSSDAAYSSGSGSGAAVASFSSSSDFDSYLEFQFENDRVIHWRTQGVDFTEKTEESRGYGGLIVGALIDLVLVGALVFSSAY